MIWVHAEGVDDVITSGDAMTKEIVDARLREAVDNPDAWLMFGNLFGTAADHVAVPARGIKAIYFNTEEI